MKLTEKIHLLRLDFQVTLNPHRKIDRFVNCIIVFGEDITLIDTGTKGCFRHIFEYIREKGRDIAEIDTVILSHSHPDHIGSAAEIKKATGCRILAHEGEKSWIENIEIQNKERPVPGFFELVDQSVKVDAALEHGRELAADKNITMKIIHSPGHSRGSVNILFQEDKILFTADAVPVKNDIPNYDDFDDLVNSLNCIQQSRNVDILLTSWTPAITGPQEIESFLNEAERYLEALDETVKQVYVGEEPEPLAFCRTAILKLALPDFYVNPIVDRAFRSHTINALSRTASNERNLSR